MKSKKGVMSWEYIVAGVMVLVVLIVVLMIFNSGASKGKAEILDKIDSTKDSDNDGTPNLLDKCDCDNRVGTGFTDDVPNKAACHETDC